MEFDGLDFLLDERTVRSRARDAAGLSRGAARCANHDLTLFSDTAVSPGMVRACGSRARVEGRGCLWNLVCKSDVSVSGTDNIVMLYLPVDYRRKDGGDGAKRLLEEKLRGDSTTPGLSNSRRGSRSRGQVGGSEAGSQSGGSGHTRDQSQLSERGREEAARARRDPESEVVRGGDYGYEGRNGESRMSGVDRLSMMSDHMGSREFDRREGGGPAGPRDANLSGRHESGGRGEVRRDRGVRGDSRESDMSSDSKSRTSGGGPERGGR